MSKFSKKSSKSEKWDTREIKIVSSNVKSNEKYVVSETKLILANKKNRNKKSVKTLNSLEKSETIKKNIAKVAGVGAAISGIAAVTTFVVAQEKDKTQEIEIDTNQNLENTLYSDLGLDGPVEIPAAPATPTVTLDSKVNYDAFLDTLTWNDNTQRDQFKGSLTWNNGQASLTQNVAITFPVGFKLPDNFIMNANFEGSTFLGDLTLPSSVTSLPYKAFWHAQFHGSLFFPDGITDIGQFSFVNARFLDENATFSFEKAKITTIPINYFNESRLPIHFKLPPTLTSISVTFLKSELMGDLIIPKSVTNIEPNVFDQMNIHGSIIYEDNVAQKTYNDYLDTLTWSDNAQKTTFKNTLTWNGDNATLTRNVSFTFPVGFRLPDNFLMQYSLRGSTFLGDLTLPSSLTSLPSNAFRDVQFHGSLFFPDGITNIGQDSFVNARFLDENATFSFEKAKITTIPINFFNQSRLPIHFKLPPTLTSISGIFYQSELMGDLVIPISVTSVDSQAFRDAIFHGKIIYEKNIGVNNPVQTAYEAFLDTLTWNDAAQKQNFKNALIWDGDIATLIRNVSLTFPASFRLPDNFIMNANFRGSTFLGDLTLPSSLTSLPNNAFRDVQFHGSLFFPDGITSIGDYAFHTARFLKDDAVFEFHKAKITTITDASNMLEVSRLPINFKLPPTLTSLSPGQLWGAELLGDLIIPKSVTSIAIDAFNRMNIHGQIIYEKNIGVDNPIQTAYEAFLDTLTWNDATQKQNFKNALIWNGDIATLIQNVSLTFPSSFRLPNNFIMNANFQGSTFLGDLTLPSSLTSLPNDAFKDVQFHGSLFFPDGITSIGSYAFNSARFLKDDAVFEFHKAKITTITDASNMLETSRLPINFKLPPTLTSLPTGLLWRAELLGDLIIPKSVTSIATNAFNQANIHGQIIYESTSHPTINGFFKNSSSSETGLSLNDMDVTLDSLKINFLSNLPTGATFKGVTISDPVSSRNSLGIPMFKQHVEFTISMGGADVKYVVEITVNVASKGYFELMILSGYVFDVDELLKNLPYYQARSLGTNPANVILLYRKDANGIADKSHSLDFSRVFPQFQIKDISIVSNTEGDSTRATLRITISTARGDINHDVVFDFKKSPNQLATDALNDHAILQDAGGRNPGFITSGTIPTSKDELQAMLDNTNILKDPNISISDINVVVMPSASQDEMRLEITAKVAYGNANPKTITFVGRIDTGSQFYINTLLATDDNNQPFQFSVQQQLLTDFGILGKIDTTQSINLADFDKYISTSNAAWWNKLLNDRHLEIVSSPTINGIIDGDSRTTTITFGVRYHDKSTNHVGPEVTISLPVQYPKSPNELKTSLIQPDSTVHVVSDIFSKVNSDLQLGGSTVTSDFLDTNFFNSFIDGYKATITNVGDPTQSKNANGEIEITQRLTFNISYGTATPITYEINVKLDTNSKAYIEQILVSNVEIGVSDAIKNLETFALGSLGNDPQHNFLVFYPKVNGVADKSNPISFTQAFPGATISDIRITKVPSYDNVAGQITITFTTPQGAISHAIDFNFNKSPNKVALEKALSPSSGQVTSTAWTMDNNGVITIYAKGSTNGFIGEVAPTNAELGSNTDINKLFVWLRANTNFVFQFPNTLSGSDGLINQVSVSGFTYNLDINRANQVLRITFSSGSETKELVFNLVFEKSNYQKVRENAIQQMTANMLLTDDYLNVDALSFDTTSSSYTFKQPRIGDLNDLTSTDFKLGDLNHLNYEIASVDSFISPIGDSTTGTMTVTIVDRDPNGDSTPQKVIVTINFSKSPNQVRTDELANQYNSVNNTLDYVFDSFGAIPNLVWPNNEAPTVESSVKISSDKYSEVYKLTIRYGTAIAKEIYIKGNLNHETKLYLDTKLADFTADIAQSIRDLTSNHPVRSLTNDELINSGFTVYLDQNDHSRGTVKVTVDPISGKVIFGDIVLTGIEIISRPQGDDTQARARYTFAYYDAKTGTISNTITTTIETTFDYTYSANKVLLNDFVTNLSATSNDLFKKDTTTDPILASPLTSIGDDVSSMYAWLQANTNLAALEARANIPNNIVVKDVTYHFDPTTNGISVEIKYQLGSVIATTTVDFLLHFNKSANQATIDSLADDAIQAIDGYLATIRYAPPQTPTINDLNLPAGYSLSDKGIFDYVAPNNDNKNGTVKVEIWMDSDHSARRTFTISLNFTKSVNEAKLDRVTSRSYYSTDPYVDTTPTIDDVLFIDSNFSDATISNIRSVDTSSLPDADKFPDEQSRFSITVTFGQYSADVILIRTGNPLKQAFEKAMEDYSFSILPNIVQDGSQPKNAGTLDDSDISITKNGAIVSLPNGVSFDPNSFVYTPPTNDDETQGTLTFSLKYVDYIYTWTNNGVQRLGPIDFDQTPQGKGWTMVPNSKQERSYVSSQTIHFNFAHSQNYYDVQAFVSNLPTQYGAKGAGANTPISNPQFAPTTLGSDLNAQLDWLAANTNFDSSLFTTGHFTISDFKYTQDNAIKDATISINVTKGNSSLAYTFTLNFTKSYNQNILDNLDINDLITSLDPQFQTIGKESSYIPKISDFIVKLGYEISQITNFSGVANNDGKTATIDLTIWDSSDHNATRTITYNIQFDKSINDNKLDQIKSQYDVDPFWQSDIDPIGSNLLEWINKLSVSDQVAFKDGDFAITSVTQLDLTHTQSINNAWVNGWVVHIKFGNSEKDIYFGQTENPLKSNYDKIMADLQLHVSPSVTDLITSRTDQDQHHKPVIGDITFTKNGVDFVLPNDKNSSSGQMSFTITSVDLPTSDDQINAVIHYDATYTISTNGVDHTYVVRGLTFNFDYKYSINQLALQRVVQGLGTQDLTTHEININGKAANGNLADYAYSAFANANDLISKLSTDSTIDLASLLADEGVTIDSFNYGSNNQRDDKSANQNLVITFRKGNATFNVTLVIHFAKSYNQSVLDGKTQADLFSDRPFIDAYMSVTKANPPTLNDLNALLDQNYEVVSINDTSFVAPDISNGQTSASITVTIRDVNDHNATKTMVVNFNFDTIGIDVGNINGASATYSSSGFSITLPDGTKRTFTSNDPNINGYATVSTTLKANNQDIQLPSNTKLQYKVLGQDGSIASDWSDNIPTGLLNGQHVIIRVVSIDETKFTVQNSREIDLGEIQGLVIPISLPSNFNIGTPTFSGSEGRGTIVDPQISDYIINAGTSEQRSENSNIDITYTIKHHGVVNDPNPFHTNSLSSEINDLAVNQDVYGNVRAKDGYFIVNPMQDRFLVSVSGLSVTPSVGLDEININTDITPGANPRVKGHDRFATIILVHAGSETDTQSIQPQANEHWFWKYKVTDANGNLVSDWSPNFPTNLRNGYQVHVNYDVAVGYTLDQTYNDRVFDITGLLYEITLPNDINFVIPTFKGYEGSGIFATFVNDVYFTSSQFDFSEHIKVEYKVTDANGRTKQDWQDSSTITNLNVGDKVYARYAVNDSNNYILTNGGTETYIGDVTNLMITPRINPIDLVATFTGVRNNVVTSLNTKNNDGSIIQPILGVDHWHWEYQVVDANGQIVQAYGLTLTTNLDNGYTINIRVVADNNYVLDRNDYPIYSTQLSSLKTEINVKNAEIPTLSFSGNLGEGQVAQILDKNGANFQNIPGTHWVFYYVPNGYSQTQADAEMRDDNNWNPLVDENGNFNTPKNMNVYDKIYIKLAVDDPVTSVLSNDVISSAIVVTRLTINNANVNASFEAETFNNEGTLFDHYYVDPTSSSLVRREKTIDEQAIKWEIRVYDQNGQPGQWQDLGAIKNLANGMIVDVRAVVINSDYVLSNALIIKMTINGLFNKIDTTNLDIRDFRNFSESTDSSHTKVDNIAQIVNGNASLINAKVFNGNIDVTSNLPPHIQLMYKSISGDSPQTKFVDVPGTTNPPTNLKNGDRIMIYFGTDDPTYKANDEHPIVFTVAGLSPLPPKDLTPEFRYNNQPGEEAVSGLGYGATFPTSEQIVDFKWEYYVLRYDDTIGPYTVETAPSTPPNNQNWSDSPPKDLRNGDVVYYRLATELANGVIADGTHTNSDGKEVRNDYLSSPQVISGLKTVVHIDQDVINTLNNMNLTFSGFNTTGYIHEAGLENSTLKNLINSLPDGVVFTFYVNGILTDINTSTLKNGDKIEIKLQPSNSKLVLDTNNILAKSFDVSDLKNQTKQSEKITKIALTIVATISVVGIIGILIAKIISKRKNRII